MSTQSKACPFCGTGRPRVHKHTKVHGFFVYCHVCHTHGPLTGDKEQARKQWNDRPTAAEIRSRKHVFKCVLQTLNSMER